MEQVTVAVPRGIPVENGKWINKAVLRQLAGYDEQIFLEMPAGTSLQARVSAFLERVTRFQDAEQVPKILERLSVGDRVALLLQARRFMIGDAIRCMVACPGCGKNMSFDLSINKLLQTKYPEVKEYYDLEANGFRLQVRPLTAFDQKIGVLGPAENALVEELARSCIVRADPPLSSHIPDMLVDAIGAKLEEVDPLSDIRVAASCPECKYAFSASFPTEHFILKELMNTDRLAQEVHCLALNYHWSEKEILSLPMGRRRRYVELVNSAIAGGGR